MRVNVTPPGVSLSFGLLLGLPATVLSGVTVFQMATRLPEGTGREDAALGLTVTLVLACVGWLLAGMRQTVEISEGTVRWRRTFYGVPLSAGSFSCRIDDVAQLAVEKRTSKRSATSHLVYAVLRDGTRRLLCTRAGPVPPEAAALAQALGVPKPS